MSGKRELREHRETLRQKYQQEFESVGLVMPQVEIEEDNNIDLAMDGQLSRYQALLDSKEFWGGSGKKGGKRTKRRLMEFRGDNAPGGSLLSQTILNKTTPYVINVAPGQSSAMSEKSNFEMSRMLRIPGKLASMPPNGIASNAVDKTSFLFIFAKDVINRKTGRVAILAGNACIFKATSMDAESGSDGRLFAKCDTVDNGGSSDLSVDFSLCDPQGGTGLPAVVVSNKGYQLAGIWLTAFSAALLDGATATYVEPIQAQTSQHMTNYLQTGTVTGGANVMSEVAKRQIDAWANAPSWWLGFDGQAACVMQN